MFINKLLTVGCLSGYCAKAFILPGTKLYWNIFTISSFALSNLYISVKDTLLLKGIIVFVNIFRLCYSFAWNSVGFGIPFKYYRCIDCSLVLTKILNT